MSTENTLKLEYNLRITAKEEAQPTDKELLDAVTALIRTKADKLGSNKGHYRVDIAKQNLKGE